MLKNKMFKLFSFIGLLCFSLAIFAAPCAVNGNYIFNTDKEVGLFAISKNGTYTKSFLDMESDQVIYSTASTGKWEYIKGCAIRLIVDKDSDEDEDDRKGKDKTLEIKLTSIGLRNGVPNNVPDYGVWVGGSMTRVIDR